MSAVHGVPLDRLEVLYRRALASHDEHRVICRSVAGRDNELRSAHSHPHPQLCGAGPSPRGSWARQAAQTSVAAAADSHTDQTALQLGHRTLPVPQPDPGEAAPRAEEAAHVLALFAETVTLLPSEVFKPEHKLNRRNLQPEPAAPDVKEKTAKLTAEQWKLTGRYTVKMRNAVKITVYEYEREIN
ncbi:hypothetical protein Q8A73_009110 [Channa argus]|nr:hypothetical protein Q8A73_009110 [Channa argus]